MEGDPRSLFSCVGRFYLEIERSSGLYFSIDTNDVAQNLDLGATSSDTPRRHVKELKRRVRQTSSSSPKT